MAKRTAIAWTERTWNPVTGCDKLSAGCDNCYALTQAARLKAMGARRYQNDGNPATSGPGFAVTLHPELVAAPRQWRKPTMCFVNSMSDLFHAQVPLSFVQDIFDTMAATPQHTYQVLTKRASRLPKIVDKLNWPSNLWMGVTVENEAALSRIDDLAVVPTSVRFISAEPLLGPLPGLGDKLENIDWVIVGGESGPRFRALDLDWAREVREVCAQTETPFFFKQVGGFRSKSGGNLLDGEVIEQWPTPVART